MVQEYFSFGEWSVKWSQNGYYYFTLKLHRWRTLTTGWRTLRWLAGWRRESCSGRRVQGGAKTGNFTLKTDNLLGKRGNESKKFRLASLAHRFLFFPDGHRSHEKPSYDSHMMVIRDLLLSSMTLWFSWPWYDRHVTVTHDVFSMTFFNFGNVNFFQGIIRTD